ncbi:MAG: SufE family protein [Proteobacteria bacterium]|nr:SufE family protein [Pseudomonadota bacterium]
MTEKLKAILDTFHALPDREQKMEYLIELAEQYQAVPNEISARPHDKSHLVPGCESEVYAWCKKNPDNSFKFYYAVENPQGISAKAFAYILDQGMSGYPNQQIQEISGEIVFEIFGRNMVMGRSQGLTNMLMMSKGLANKA